jgi:hypothetical protein
MGGPVVVRRVPGEDERDALAGLDVELGDRVHVLADELDGRREQKRVRTGDRQRALGDTANPRDDRAVVEADRDVGAHADAAPEALDDPDDVGRLAADRHEVRHPDGAVGALELRLEHQPLAAITALDPDQVTRRAE